MNREAINKKLRAYYEFNDDDLYANKMNRLSSAQQSRLRRRNEVQRKGGIAITVFFLGLGLCLGCLGLFILMISLIEQDWSYSTSIGPMIYAFVPAFILSAIGIFMLWSTFYAGGDKGKLLRTSGPITLRIEEHTSGGEYQRKYKVHFVVFPDGSEFGFDDDLLDCIKDGEEYHANYYMFDDKSGGLVFTMEKL
jgi:hypothetical protein